MLLRAIQNADRVGRGLQSFSVPYKILAEGAGRGEAYSAFSCHTKYWQGGLGGERTTVLLHAIQNTFIIYISVDARVRACARVGATRKL